MSERPTFTVEYIEPVEAEPLPDEFSAPRLRRSLVLLTAVVIVVTAAIVLLPGLARWGAASWVPSPNGSCWPRCSSSGPCRGRRAWAEQIPDLVLC